MLKKNSGNFVKYLNSLHMSMKSTSENSTSEIAFLDIMVRIDSETKKLYTSLYTKPTDTHIYLHYTSAHQRSCIQMVPSGQLLRLRSIYNKNDNFYWVWENDPPLLNKRVLAERITSTFQESKHSHSRRRSLRQNS